MIRVAFKCSGDLFFEVVDDNEIGEEWQDIFDFEKAGVF